MISESLQDALTNGQELARRGGNSVISLAHLVLALTSEKDARHAMLACGASPDSIARSLSQFLVGHWNGAGEDDRSDLQSIEPDAACRAALEQATMHVMSHRKGDEITGADVLMSIMHLSADDGTSHVLEILHNAGVTTFGLKRFLAHGDAVDERFRVSRKVRGSTSGRESLPLSPSLIDALRRVLNSEDRKRHGYLTLDHMLLVLLHDPEARTALQACGAKLPQIQQLARDSLRLETAHIDETSNEVTDDHRSEDDAGEDDNPLVATIAVAKVMRQASAMASASQVRNHVTGVDVLVAICGEHKCHAVRILQHAGLQFDALQEYAAAFGKEKPSPQPTAPAEVETGAAEEPTALQLYCRNLNELAASGGIDPLVGRAAEVRRCFQSLLRRNKNNPLLVGDPGVGKTAIVEGIARMIDKGDAPEPMSKVTLFALEMGDLVAGTKYRGEFEERLTNVVKEIKAHQDAVLFVDEVHTIVGAGATSGGSMDASNILKPSLQDGSLRCVGSTTHRDFKRYMEKDRALARRFQKIDVCEPSTDETVKILKGLRGRFERHHDVRFSESALVRAVNLADTYIHDRRFPDKAIDIIDEAGAANRLLPKWRRKRSIRTSDIEAVVSVQARIPSRQLSKSDASLLIDLESSLKEVIFGQDRAIAAVSSAIKLGRAGLREPGKPTASYLFSGPTGVGKTEVARQLATMLNASLLRFDMSEYMEKHSVSRLIGAPPGYVGFDQGGLLTDGVDENPYCIVLLDEIEKAHPDVANLLLQVMDYGKLTDHSGRTVDFRNAVIIMTTNAGAAEQAKSALGFGRQGRSGEDMKAVERMFTPEFRNRLDAIITFDSLSPSTVLKVVDKFIRELETQLSDKNVQLELSGSAANWLADKGYDRVMGARPLARIIQEKIKQPLADMILFGALKKGGIVRILAKDDQLEFVVREKHKPRLEERRVPLLGKS